MIDRIKAAPRIHDAAKWLLARIGEGKGDDLLASARRAIAGQDGHADQVVFGPQPAPREPARSPAKPPKETPPS